MGGFSALPAPQLGAALVKDMVASLRCDTQRIDEIIMGQVLTAGVGQAPARQTALYGGLPARVCATTVNRVCGSGIKAVMLADQSIRSGDAEFIVAGGQENMSMAPHLLPASRQGYRFGAVTLNDHVQWDGLRDPYSGDAMGLCGELCAEKFGFSRAEQDAYAISSYQRARQAIKEGFFKNEIVPISVLINKKEQLISEDEEPMSVDLDRLGQLRPAFNPQGTITAGNASSLNDGAALLGVCSEAFARQEGYAPLARIIAQGSVAQEPAWFTTAPIACIRQVLTKAGLRVEDIDLFEINEAFSVVPMAAIRELTLDPARVNISGGAVALGHPIGASGARILVTLVHALRRLGKKRGLACLCIGGGEASAVVVEVC
jgi:acetyl-CoA C-acetyltransferase